MEQDSYHQFQSSQDVETAISTSQSIISPLKYFIISLRPYQWSKNLLVFAALIFSGNLFQIYDLLFAVITFLLVSLVAGWVYVVNDLKDIEEDRLHPVKKHRPIASGKVNPYFALVLSSTFLIAALVISVFISTKVTLILLIYGALNFLYSHSLKHVVILDILIVAIGFVLRAVVGAYAIDVAISPWLLVCTFFLALFLVVGKRRSEVTQLGENAVNHRRILMEYNPKILDQMISVVTAATVLGYALYTLDSHTVEYFGTHDLIYTVPFVVYGIFRYFYLIYKQELGGAPEKILFQDKFTLVNIVLWVVSVSIIIYFK